MLGHSLHKREEFFHNKSILNQMLLQLELSKYGETQCMKILTMIGALAIG